MRPTLTHLPRPRSNFSAPSVIFVISVFAWDGIRMEILSVKRNPYVPSRIILFMVSKSIRIDGLLDPWYLDQVSREEILFLIN